MCDDPVRQKRIITYFQSKSMPDFVAQLEAAIDKDVELIYHHLQTNILKKVNNTFKSFTPHPEELKMASYPCFHIPLSDVDDVFDWIEAFQRGLN